MRLKGLHSTGMALLHTPCRMHPVGYYCRWRQPKPRPRGPRAKSTTSSSLCNLIGGTGLSLPSNRSNVCEKERTPCALLDVPRWALDADLSHLTARECEVLAALGD